MPEPDISVVVCTRNRPDELKRVLGSLAAQTLPRKRFEVIVVDNGGDAQELALTEGADVVVAETTPGLSRARNLGWQRAKADFIAFIDDDAEAAPDWIEEALRLFAGLTDPPAAVGGPILPLWDAPRPRWFKDDYERRSWGNEERLLEPGENLSGSNMFLSRSTLARLSGFDVHLGLAGGRFLLSEDTDLFQRLWETNPPPVVIYSPQLIVRHSVPKHKMTVRYQLRRASAWGESYMLGQRLPPHQARRTIPSNATALIRELVRALGALRVPIQQWAVDDLQQSAERFGMIKGALRGR